MRSTTKSEAVEKARYIKIWGKKKTRADKEFLFGEGERLRACPQAGMRS
jgi:hypothetical protein